MRDINQDWLFNYLRICGHQPSQDVDFSDIDKSDFILPNLNKSRRRKGAFIFAPRQDLPNNGKDVEEVILVFKRSEDDA